MIENHIRIPQIIAVILEGFVMIITFFLIANQESVIAAYATPAIAGTHVFPTSQVLQAVFHFLLFLICLLTMLHYKGEHRRLIAGIFIALIIIVSALAPYYTSIGTLFAARKGSDYLAALSSLSSHISFSTAPLNVTSTALFFIACGRYGISEG